MLLIVTVYYFE